MGTRNHLRKLRPIWNAIIRTNGHWPCRRCGQPIHPGDPYDLGHPNDAAPHLAHTTNVQPEHPHCNRSAGATAGNHARAGRIQPSREW